MQRLYEITIPGLSMRADLPAVRHRLLADFPQVLDVFAMTRPHTVLVVYLGEEEVDAWIDALSDSVATRRVSLGRSHVFGTETGSGLSGSCSSFSMLGMSPLRE